MSFARPELLLLLPLVLFALLVTRAVAKRRPRDATTFILFRRAQARLEETPQRRRPRLRDLLRGLPLLLTLLAIAGPRLEGVEEEAPVTVIVDRSASMATLSEGSSRLARGLARLERELEARELTLVGVPAATPGGTAVDFVATRSPDTELVRLAGEARAAGKPVVVLSDRDALDLPEGCGHLIVTDDAPNLGIVAAALDAAGRLLVRVEGTSGHSGADIEVGTLALGRGEETMWPAAVPDAWRERLSVPAGEAIWRRELPVPAPGENAFVLTLKAKGEDGNPLDDVVVLAPVQRLSVADLPLRGASAIERALAALPGVVVTRGGARADLAVGRIAEDAGALSLLVAPQVPPGFTLGNAGPQSGRLTGTGSFRGLPASRLELPQVFTLTERPLDAEELVTLGDAPLLVRRGRQLLLLQDPEGTSWPDDESFPLLFDALLTGFGPPTGRAHEVAKADAMLPLEAGGEGELLLLREPESARRLGLPSFQRRVLPPGPEPWRISVPLPVPGLYCLRDRGSSAGPRWRSRAVLDPRVTKGPFAASGSWRAPVAAGAPREASHSLSPWLFALAALILAVSEFGLGRGRGRRQ